MESIFDKIGGRKFVMALVLIVAGALVDVLAPNGLSVNLMGLMTAVYAAFTASNAFVTNKHLESESKAPTEGESGQPASEAVQQLAQQLLPVVNNIGKALDDLYKQQSAQSESLANQSKAISHVVSIMARPK